MLAERGRQYAVYLWKGGPCRLTLALPAGTYEATWIATTDGTRLATQTIDAAGAPVTLTSPAYDPDIALAILRK